MCIMALITCNKLAKKVNEGIQVFHMSNRYMFGRKINSVSALASVFMQAQSARGRFVIFDSKIKLKCSRQINLRLELIGILKTDRMNQCRDLWS